MSWAGFAAVFAAFFVTHSVPVRPPVKARLVGLLGSRGFSIAYSLLSLGMLWLLIRAAALAPYVELWSQQLWHRHITQLLMLVACLLLTLSIARPNPFSFGGARNESYAPNHPGITRLTRHPILAALALWAGAHLLSNGDVAHVLLFGILGVFAVAGRLLIDQRKRRVMGAQVWEDMERRRRAASLLQRPDAWPMLLLRILLGFAAYGALVWTHPYFAGVPAV